MPLNSTYKSARFLQGRRYTHDSYTDAQEAFTSVLDINANEVYVDHGLIPSSGLPYRTSGDNLSVYTSGGLNVMKYYYRYKMTKSDLNNEVWFFTVPTGSTSGIGAQLIDAGQQTNFISPKYSIASLSNANTEDVTTGYLAKVFVSTGSTAPADTDVVSVNNYSFDYKTGVLEFLTTGVTPSASQYVYISVYQYVGRTLNSTIGVPFSQTGSYFSTSNNIQITGSLNVTGSVQVSGNTTTRGIEFAHSDTQNSVGSGTSTVTSFPLTYGVSAYFHYVVYNTVSSARRAGHILAVWDSGGAQYRDDATPDLNGSTLGVEFKVDVSGTDVRLLSVVSSGTWNINIETKILTT